ncbi:MAG: hypothetical protein EOP14_02900 [Pseudomonas sp.]|nr:MAG: hypothetical protein EOP14_02900 [Pseudomonas sp.]
MKTFSRKNKMDELVSLEYDGWTFLCSGEELPSGSFEAAVRHRTRPVGQIRTLVFGKQTYPTYTEALENAKALALSWAQEHWSDDLGHG